MTEPEATEADWFAWLCRKYVQRADERQRDMGLQYTEAETHDLAAEIAKRVAIALDRFRAERVEAERQRIESGLKRAWTRYGPVKIYLDEALPVVRKELP